MDDLAGSGDPGIDAFVDANLTSFAAWDIAVYLERDLGVSAGVSELAGRLGRKEFEIEPVLRDFVERGIATASPEPDGVVRYTLSEDPKVRSVVSRFVELVQRREVRLEFVRRVLAQMWRI